MIPGSVEIVSEAASPFARREVMTWLRVDHLDDQVALDASVDAAIHACKAHTGRTILDTAYRIHLDTFPDGDRLTLPVQDVRSITSVKYDDVADVEQTFSSSEYAENLHEWLPYVQLNDGSDWPDISDNPLAVRIDVAAGYTTRAAIPKSLAQGILMFAAHLYESRSATSMAQHHAVPLSVDALWTPHRRSYVA